MTLEIFFKCLQQNNIPDDLIIFKCPKITGIKNDTDTKVTYSCCDSFLAIQYINEIAKQHNLTKNFIEDINEIKTVHSIFDTLIEPTLQIYRVDKFESNNIDLLSAKNLIIICCNIPKDTEKIFTNNIIELPKLTEWHIKDYIYSQLDKMNPDNLEELTKLCNNNIYRVDNEISRLKIFSLQDRDTVFYKFKQDLIYDDLINNTIFDFINAIITKNIEQIKTIYLNLQQLDSSPFGILALLYNNFRNIISIQLNPLSSPENTGLSKGQFWAISNQIGHYTNSQLLKIFDLISDIDRKVKIGELDTDLILDYLLVNILGC